MYAGFQISASVAELQITFFLRKIAKKMSEENDKDLEAEDTCRSLAEELLREMPDMKDEIEQELKDALSKSNDNIEENKEEDDAKAPAAKESPDTDSAIQEEPSKMSENVDAVEESKNSADVELDLENSCPSISIDTPANGDVKAMESTDMLEVKEVKISSTECGNEEKEKKVEKQEVNETCTEQIKTETTICENKSSEDVKLNTDDCPIAAKKPKLEIPTERKSIIEIHIANKVVDDKEALAELERIRKLKEQTIIELNRLKCQEDKLLRIETINKQLQRNIEHKCDVTTNENEGIIEKKKVCDVPTSENEEIIEKKKVVVEEKGEEETEKKIETKNKVDEGSAEETVTVVTTASTPACAESLPSIENVNSEDPTNLTTDVEMSTITATEIATASENVTREEELPNSNNAVEILKAHTDAETEGNIGAAACAVPVPSAPASPKSVPSTESVNHKESTNSNTGDENKNVTATDISPGVTTDAITMPTTSIEVAATSTAVTTTSTTAPSTSIPPDESSNHSITGEPDHNLPPEELTAEEEERDRELRASRATFLQHLPCFKLQRNSVSASSSEVDSNDNAARSQPIPRCRECRRRNTQGVSDVYCRFYEFRRLQYNEVGELLVAGFPNPYKDPTPDDLRIWQPDKLSEPTAGWMDIQVARYILLHAGDQFCYLWQQEAEALRLHENPNTVIAWKKVVQGLREICDVCDTTLFNFHWTCDKCGFGVCLDCFKDRKEQRSCRKRRTGDKTQRGHDEFHWMLCTATTPSHQKHELRELMLTQIIAGDALNVLGRLLHDIRAMWQVPQMCGCLLSKQDLPPDTELGTLIQDMIKESQLKQQTSASSLATEETLRKQARMEELHAKKLEFARARGIDYVPGRVWTKETLGKDPITTAFDNFKHINFLRKGLAGLRRFLPPRAMTLTYSTLLAPGVPHEWLCDGKLLRLTNAMHPDNRILFQEVWKCGQPVVISEVARSLNLDLWRPEAFCNDFGDKPNDLINCLNGNLVPNQPMRYFWEGFQCIKKRLLDAYGKPMLLKLKDWPPGDDFAEILPTRFADLMTGLPMPEYTLRTGNLNIASSLPKMFVPPDLGPKMYNAYGSALHPDKGTTNLHLDISDAVNIMVYVGVPQDADSKPQLVATQRAIALGGCDYLTRARCQSPNVLPGALWHIFPARDADKIRDLLNRVTIEKGFRLEPDHDPIHDQNWYLDDKLRARLFKEYGVEGYPIVQCLGDAVFIPAGAPHQVQNLHNCIKVAEDFVSPENITHCYHLTHEFRHLSHSHTNHEDKLQIKNIIYHAIKDCCHILVSELDQRLDEELAKVEEQNAKAQMSLIEATELAAKLTGGGVIKDK
ncbi:lysine-specific demethylase 3A-A isoform X1 [Anastrepha ludens]|uniref:lysine-specific demethylase 3A-A isoform X1 n=2 Tax=Anastrepha ludens TaxID=28586 RepID=UPI0023AEF257|nr:lysine-specific demethylase 3A-A isoform X1 [Anastrepha ludens]